MLSSTKFRSVYVGFPNIAQSQLNKSTLNVTSQQITNPLPNSIQLAQTSIAYNPSSYHPNLDGFQAAFYLEDTEPNIQPFAYLNIPPIHATRATEIITNQTLNIANMDQFIAYNSLVFTSTVFRVGLRGTTKLHEMKFPTATVDFNKIVTMNGELAIALSGKRIDLRDLGLNGFNGFNITQFQLFLEPQGADGANLIGEATIPNPSVMSVEFGNVTFDVSVDGQNIGQSRIDNLFLVPGNNTVPVRSTTNQTAVLNLISTKYKDCVLPLAITGNSTVVNGNHLPYFEDTFQKSTQHLNLNLAPSLAKLQLDVCS